MPAKKQITKEMILAAALKMLREGGLKAVHVKALAKKLNCSTQPIYLSFNSMDALRAELSPLVVDAFVRKVTCCQEQANLYGMAYIQFAQEETNLFQFLFMRQNAFLELREALAPMMNASIARLMEQYQIEWEEAHHFHDQLWMHTHGIASMIATGFCVWNMNKVEKMLAECEKYLSQKYGGQNVFQ